MMLLNNSSSNRYDAIVVGAGHAGIEASLSLARQGFKTLNITLNIQLIGEMACNPSVGGVAKGIVVREIDALGGEMAKVADETGIQFRMLNMSKGPAVWSPRVQVDKVAYSLQMQKIFHNQENLFLLEDKVEELIIENSQAVGVVTERGHRIFAKVVVITAGTFLKGRVFMGDYQSNLGRVAETSAEKLSTFFKNQDLDIKRMKTGTPVRINSKSIDYSKVEEQENQDFFFSLSYQTKIKPRSKVSCFITYTNSQTHEIIAHNLDLSPQYGSQKIKGVGPRYCPSIEDKIVKFPEKTRHQIFLEPETLYHNSVYVNGISSCLPPQVQRDFLHTIEGLENAEVLRYGYAVEYDYFNPQQLHLSLENKKISHLFLAGQVNGTTGYEEAGAQGLIAGINAGQKLKNEEPLILSRDQSYIGIMIDDLVTKGVTEPYRLFNSSSEYRLHLRHDNADERLMPIAFKLGIFSAEFMQPFFTKWQSVSEQIAFLHRNFVKPQELEKHPFLGENKNVKVGDNYSKLVSKGISLNNLAQLLKNKDDLSEEALFSIFVQSKYEGYLKQQQGLINKFRKMEEYRIPKNIDYYNIEHLKNEAREKLTALKPLSLGQASRVSGIYMTDIWSIIIYLEKNKLKYKNIKI